MQVGAFLPNCQGCIIGHTTHIKALLISDDGSTSSDPVVDIVACSGLTSAWMVYVIIGNHTADSRNPPYGKAVVAILSLPEPVAGENKEAYKLASKMMYQRWWDCFTDDIRRWEAGIVLKLPGDDKRSVVQFRLGPLLGDLLEARAIAATSSSRPVRCNATIGKHWNPAPPAVESDTDNSSHSSSTSGATSSSDVSVVEGGDNSENDELRVQGEQDSESDSSAFDSDTIVHNEKKPTVSCCIIPVARCYYAHTNPVIAVNMTSCSARFGRQALARGCCKSIHTPSGKSGKAGLLLSGQVSVHL